MAQSKRDPAPDLPLSVRKYFLAALAQYVAVVVLFVLFYGLEVSGERVGLPWIVTLLYNAGGKWLDAGVFAALGTLFLLLGSVVKNKKP